MTHLWIFTEAKLYPKPFQHPPKKGKHQKLYFILLRIIKAYSLEYIFFYKSFVTCMICMTLQELRGLYHLDNFYEFQGDLCVVNEVDDMHDFAVQVYIDMGEG